MGGTCDVSREQLYRELWSEPATSVAKRYGISDVGLAKVCRRYRVPKPGPGYWALRQAGKAPATPPLPAADNPALETISFQAGDPSSSAPDVPEYDREKDPEWLITVPPDLRSTHPLVKAAAAALHGAAKGPRQSVRWQERYRAHLVSAGEGCLDIAVSKPLISRALRIMQALVSALEKRGYAISVNKRSETIVTVLDENFQIALIEQQRQVKVAHEYGSGVDLEPSGRLRLRIGPDYSGAGVRDDPPRLIEDLLNRLIASLVRRAVEAKRQRAIREERERRWRLHDDERRLRDQERHSEQLRRRRLRALAARWVQHRRLSEFVALVDRRILDGHLEGEAREAATRWVEWAKATLGSTDPIDALLAEPWPTAPLPPPMSSPWNWE
jgi:hypothetical protein